MRTHFLRAVAALFLFCGTAGIAIAQPPTDLGLQGRLYDAAGAPLSGRVDIEVTVHDAISGGDPLYGELHESVNLGDAGGFHLVIGTGSEREGSLDAETFSGANRYLEMVVDGDVMEPRQPLHSVPYALQATEARRAKVAERIEGFDPEEFDQSGHVERTDNPHRVTAAQVGAVSRSEIRASVATHAGDASAHHAKTTSFRDLTDEVTDRQVPAAVARDAEVLDIVRGGDGAGSGLDADTLDGVDASELARADDPTWVKRSGDSMTGDLTVDGRVESSQGYRYSSPQTAYASASGAAYAAYSATQATRWNRNGILGAYVTADGFGSAVQAYAPIDLPHGAHVRGIKCRFRDTAPNADVQILASITRRSFLATNTFTNVALIVQDEEIDSDQVQVVEAEAATFNTVDNEDNAYGLSLFWTVTANGQTNPTDLTWYGCSVEYETSEVLN